MSKKINAIIKSNVLFVWVAIHLVILPGLAPTSVTAAAFDRRPTEQEENMHDDPVYIQAIQRTAAMAGDPTANTLAQSYGLNIVNVMWEDTGRYKGSTVGPNISDVTIQVQHRDPGTRQYQLSLMPVIRYPNYSDLSADVPLDQFYLLVGNENGEPLQKVSLREYLGNFRSYLNRPNSWLGERDSLLAERDSYALVSAQAAFLPVPAQGKAEFNPVIFNYQSSQGNPAVLTIIATREGTSATIIDNMRDAFPAGFSWGQRLFFNQDGERASFTGERLSDFTTRQGEALGEAPAAAGESGLNMVLVIQVPLKYKEPPMREMTFEAGLMYSVAAPMAKSDVEAAVIGHGPVEGPFTEIDGLEIERDDRFPVRVTVQFYKATSNGAVSEADVQEIASQIQRVYQDAAYVGSLVVEGETGRPTEYEGPKEEPPGWWADFWQRFEGNTGLTRQQGHELWQMLNMKARDWFHIPR